MKKIMILMIMMGFVGISACASNETMDDAESDAKAKAETMKEEQSAAAEEKKAAAEADMEEKADEAVEQAEEKVEATTMTESDSDANASVNLVSTCKKDDYVRVISVVYDNPETDTVCEVTYEKSSGVQTLWSANNERDYCLDKAIAFVEKQEGWGWTCSALQ
jgi:predicted  nucleic acid-binding Zn-ribbon protein